MYTIPAGPRGRSFGALRITSSERSRPPTARTAHHHDPPADTPSPTQFRCSIRRDATCSSSVEQASRPMDHRRAARTGQVTASRRDGDGRRRADGRGNLWSSSIRSPACSIQEIRSGRVVPRAAIIAPTGLFHVRSSARGHRLRVRSTMIAAVMTRRSAPGRRDRAHSPPRVARSLRCRTERGGQDDDAADARRADRRDGRHGDD
jgi:hypothetical protein